MKKTLLLGFLLLSFYLLKAQDSKWAVSFTPALVQSPAIHYAVQPGFEYKFNDRLSILTEFAFTTRKDKDSSFTNGKYFRIKPELRYAIRKSKWGPELYGGLQLSFSYRKWDDLNGGCYFKSKSQQDSSINFTRGTITSPILTSSLQFGIIYSLGDHISIDFFAWAHVSFLLIILILKMQARISIIVRFAKYSLHLIRLIGSIIPLPGFIPMPVSG
jgi:hypothetical protein